jgi:tetratricopeptide (TPR) repeat protein
MRRRHTESSGRAIALRLSVLLAHAIVMAGLTAFATPLWAQEEGERLGDRATRQTASMRESTYKELARAQEAAESAQYSEAIRLLEGLGDDGLNSYERAQMLNLYAYVYYLQDNYPKAISTYETLLEVEDLPEAMGTGAVYTLAQLYFSTENWRRAADMMNRWLALNPDPKPRPFEILAQAYYQLEDYRSAVGPILKVVELTRKEGRVVDEQTYLLLRVLYYELGELERVAEILQELIKLFPSKQYWIQLAGIYGELEDRPRQLNTFELAHLQGLLATEAEVMSLAGLLLQNDLPFRAGKVLDAGLEDGTITSTLESWRLLAHAWTLAQEDDWAIPALQRAAQLSEDGELDVVLAQTFMNLDRWGDAAQALRAAVAKGGLERADQAYIMLGQALFNMRAFDEARAAFEAAGADRRSSRLAGQWVNYADNEEDRLAQLEAALE